MNRPCTPSASSPVLRDSISEVAVQQLHPPLLVDLELQTTGISPPYTPTLTQRSIRTLRVISILGPSNMRRYVTFRREWIPGTDGAPIVERRKRVVGPVRRPSGWHALAFDEVMDDLV
jgi:hypothetical protein